MSNSSRRSIKRASRSARLRLARSFPHIHRALRIEGFVIPYCFELSFTLFTVTLKIVSNKDVELISPLDQTRFKKRQIAFGAFFSPHPSALLASRLARQHLNGVIAAFLQRDSQRFGVDIDREEHFRAIFTPRRRS